MSWIIQTTLKNRDIIREKKDIESDEFNDLMIIEAKIQELYNEEFLSDVDMMIINGIADGSYLTELEEVLGRRRSTISKTFEQICNRVAYFLGDYFTDEGFLQNMKYSYRLNDEQINKIRSHIESRFRHKLMRIK